ncbi:MAG TPA: LytTR family DNA-binding domain-containing protein [Terracidiphilus sp.]|jgi:two-component system LytT family response regulator|nr:LytTR family DNA-binding domain-containing protein [Terracidiphilus sp.]
MKAEPVRAYLVDDEPLAIQRLERLLAAIGGVAIEGRSTDPAQALAFLSSPAGRQIDVLFLDIQMPGMNGFELLSRLHEQPCVIFTTAFDEYALRAFEVNSIDYLLKPIDPEQLSRALRKFNRLHPRPRPAWQQQPDMPALLRELAATLRGERPEYPRRIATRIGERITFLDLDQVTHFVANDKLTYAVVNGRQHCVDQTIKDLEQRLDPVRFFRIHRAVLVNVEWIKELAAGFAGKLVVTLKDAQHTQLTVARDRVAALKERLGV